MVDTLSSYFSEIEKWEKQAPLHPLMEPEHLLFSGESKHYEYPCHSSISRLLNEKGITLTQQKEKTHLNNWVNSAQHKIS